MTLLQLTLCTCTISAISSQKNLGRLRNHLNMEAQLLKCAWEKCLVTFTLALGNKSEDCFPSRSLYVSTTVRNAEKFGNIFIPTMSFLGIICNILNIYVLSRFRNKSCFHRLLCFLAIFDIFTLCSGGLYVLHIFQSELNILCKNHSFQVFILTLDKIAYFMIRGSSWP